MRTTITTRAASLRGLWVGVVLLLAGAAGVCGQQAELPTDEQLQFANGLYARGMYELAVTEYEGYLARIADGDGADAAWFRVGECYRNLDKPREAEKAFRTVFTTFLDSEFRLRAGFRRADLFLAMGHHGAAIDLFKVVLDLKPPPDLESACLYLQGTAYLKAGKTGEALGRFRTVIDKYGDSRFHQYAILELGGIHANPDSGATDLAKAEALYRQVADAPGSPRVGAEALFQLGDLYFRGKDYSKSADAYRKLLTTYPKDERIAEAMLQAAWAAHNAGLYVEALERATQALAALDKAETATVGEKTDRTRAEWLYLKANCERQLLKHGEAVTTYTELLSGFPGAVYAQAARYEKSLVYYKMGDFENAIKESKRINADETLRKDVYWLLAESHAALKKTESAVQYYRLICREFPKSDVACDATYRLAHHLRAQGSNKEAATWYQTVAHDFPESPLAPRALFASALCLLKEDLFAEAVRDWSALITRYGDHTLVEEAVYQRSMAEIRLDRHQDAMNSLRDLLRRFPESRFVAEAHYWLGILYKDTEQFGDAETELRRALEAKPKKELDRKALFFLGVVLQKNDKMGEAADCFQALLDSPMNDKFTPALLEWLALYRFENKKYEEANSAADTLVRTAKDPEWQQIAWGLKGRSEAALGHKDAAVAALRKALTFNVSTRYAPESALRLADVMRESGAFDEAQRLYEKAASLSGGADMLAVRARAYAGLAYTAEAKGDTERAVRLFMSVAVLYDDDQLVPECLVHAANGFEKLGKSEQKQDVLGELKTRYPNSAQARSVAGNK